MPTTIGSKPPVAEDPFAWLADCHERIRRFSSLAVTLSRAPAETPAAELADAAASIVRYFTVALPLHEQDEEASLAPRLENRALSDAARTALASLAPDHRRLEDVLAGLVPHWQAVAKDPASLERAAVARPSEHLVELFDSHLRMEESVLFPAARTAMTPAELTALLGEMRSRRR